MVKTGKAGEGDNQENKRPKSAYVCVVEEKNYSVLTVAKQLNPEDLSVKHKTEVYFF